MVFRAFEVRVIEVLLYFRLALENHPLKRATLKENRKLSRSSVQKTMIMKTLNGKISMRDLEVIKT